jgi:hypothetical protein
MKSALKVGRVRRATSLLGALVGVLLFSALLFSQSNFGLILGIVTDQTGGVVAGATVTVIDTQRGVARTLTTDDAGEYNAPTLIPGAYMVRVEAKGFKKLERENVVVEVGKDVRVDVTVQPGEQTQTVTVTEAIPLVETTNATLGGLLSNATINDLPLNGRDCQNLLGLRQRFGAEFRVEFFNVLNHPNLANPYGGVVGSNIGIPRAHEVLDAGAERLTS